MVASIAVDSGVVGMVVAGSDMTDSDVADDAHAENSMDIKIRQ